MASAPRRPSTAAPLGWALSCVGAALLLLASGLTLHSTSLAQYQLPPNALHTGTASSVAPLLLRSPQPHWNGGPTDIQNTLTSARPSTLLHRAVVTAPLAGGVSAVTTAVLSAAALFASSWLARRLLSPGASAVAIFPVTGLATAPMASAGLSPLSGPRPARPTLGSLLPTIAASGRPSMALGALKTGIVGLPNVGKSTLFNALTGGVTAEAANYPFCTIDPNIGVVEVPDRRLTTLATISGSQRIVPATLEFVDIAGIVKGASKGEGMGNKFLSNIRECDAIVHVVRCFEDENVIHVSGQVDPVSDMDIINLELIFADLEQVERRRERAAKDKKASEAEKAALEKLFTTLEAGRPARQAGLTEDERFSIKSLGLLTLKPMLYAANVPEDSLAEGNELLARVKVQAATEGAPVIVVSAQLEAELVELSKDERIEMLNSLGVDEENCGLKALVREAYSALGLQTYFTTGVQESRAWTVRKGATAPQAAGVIHGDFERGFIRAETIAFRDLVDLGSEKKAREAGKVRSEGKEYIVQEADVMHFLFNV
eukprot:EG_transcript_7356